ncbi:putative ABC transport system permease protein [Carnobacterium iners]|uniref:Putative ABC transport system permease protein n=1 Tax=Carnobacterium iners TaxID=1073423 RepID=A0A1X7N8X0_9LACT|nr:FtsX-like permease family protein [Carnobacterium iners]SEK46007.1 putative ABC transport system permease protein [Carnobacterium iners]SMH33041.1 putative ABC transport system permease protein [Carnobacterium iners]
MKKKALWKDIFKEIWKSKGRFLSIFAIITLGVAFFAGIKATGPNMIDTADHYYREKNLMDLKVVSTYGLEEYDIKQLQSVENVIVRGAYSQDVILEDSALVTKVFSYPKNATEKSNQYAIISGRLPGKSGEIALDATEVYTSEYSLGDQIDLTTDDEENPLSDKLKITSYKIVGFVNSPQYIENFTRGNSTVGKGTLDGFAVILDEDFDMEVYTEAYLTFSDTKSLLAYSEKYEEKVDKYRSKIENMTKSLPQNRLESIQKEAQIEIDKGQREVDEAKVKLADGQKKLNEAKKELTEGSKDYQEGLATFEKEITSAQAEIDKNSKKISDGKKELATQKENLEAGQTELNKAELTFNERKKSAEAELAAGEKELTANQQILSDSFKAISQSKAEIKNNEEKIQAEKNKLEQGQIKLTQSKQNVKNQKANLISISKIVEKPVGSITQTEIITALAKAQEIDKVLSTSLGQQLTSFFAGNTPAASVKTTIIATNGSITEGENALKVQQNEINQGSAEIEVSENKLNKSKETIEQSQTELEAAQSQLNEAKASFEQQKISAREQLAAGENEIVENQQKINEGKQAIQEAEAELIKGENQLVQGKETLKTEQAKGEAELGKAKASLDEGQDEYNKAAKEFEKKNKEAVEEIADGEADLLTARQELADLAKPEYFVFDRSTNPGYKEYSDNAERISAIAQVFPVFFFLIAALVSLTTMTRMVDEQRLQIGTLKALGYTSGDIAKKFLVYASLASVFGTIIGLVIGYQVFPSIIFNAYGSLYNMPDIRITYYISYGVISFIIAILSTVAAAYAATRVALQSNAATLMRPKAPKIGKRIFLERLSFVWNRMGFIQKVTARNLFRYKQRMLMTVLGVAGCTALILTGFGLSDSIADISSLQYGKLMKYDAIVAFNNEATKEEKEQYQEFIDSQSSITNNMNVLQESYTVSEKDVNTQDVTVFVPEEKEELSNYLLLNNRKSGEVYSLPDEGVIITEKLAKLFGLDIGDTITLKDEDNKKMDGVVKQIAENYAGHYVFMTSDSYMKLVGKRPAYNTQLLMYQANKAFEDKLGSDLTAQPSVAAVSFVSQVSSAVNDTTASLAIVTLVLIISAGLLAFVVLYNLTNINVSERIRELSTIKVLGFYDKEVTTYIYRENIILSLMGIVVGSGLGALLHSFVLQTAEIDMLMFSPDIRLLSYVYSGLLTLLFSGIVMYAMHIKLKNIDMIEALKSVD